MKNFLQEGLIVTVPAPATTASGDFVVVGGFAGVAQADAASGTDVNIVRAGFFTLPKATGAAWTKGDALYWDAGNKKFTTVAAAGLVPRGIAAADAASGDATGAVALVPTGVGHRFVAGQFTSVTAADTIATGLTKVVACGVTEDSDPIDDPEWFTATIGDQSAAPIAGSIIIKGWKNTSGSDPTPAAASTFSKKVNWWAFGY